ncbi:inositol-1,4,5-trisphosphate (IP3) 5-phosphatase [Novymonas esmeraldas]|uniref:Inositol-1,4,5-trisphosphate (IP3) 5-phosphatase n=1 Tax=Novymonas esmeraldas TaxID=1808958 RepID=A0AAW0EM45_9TRYP
MSSSSPPAPVAGHVAAAAALRFSVDFDPTRADSQPSVLLLTQNVGGIEAALSGGGDALLQSPRSQMPDLGRDLSSAFATMSSAFTVPSFVHVSEEIEVDVGVSAAVRQQVAEFLADVRQWLHRLSYVAAAVRAAEGHFAATTAPPESAAGAAPPPSSSSGGELNADAHLRSYTTAARPPLVDVVVLHFQEIGGKYKNKQFNEYFKEQVRTALLPEAGWTSGLLMDEREGGGNVSSSHYRRSNVASAVRPRRHSTFDGSNASTTLNGDVSGIGSSAFRRPSASHSTDADVGGGELDADADTFFTAIGSVVFLSPRVMGIASCLSVPHRTYIPVVDDPLTYAGEAGRLFHSGKFAEAGRSRKGFLLVSLRLGTVQLNVCNVHLFNDDDNRTALASSPSPYAERRARALKEAVAECSAVVDLGEPLFVLGDFNVRLDGKPFLEWAESVAQVTVHAEKKRLRCPDHFWALFTDPATQQEMRGRFDVEPQHLMDEVASVSGVELAEMPVSFAPTYSRIAYRTRVASTTAKRAATAASSGTATPREAANTPEAPAPASWLRGAVPAGEEQAAASQHKARPPLSTPPPAVMSSSSPLPPLTPPLPSAPLKHVTASPYRDNLSHDRLPAWCDRVLFNVAGLDWVSGNRARASPPPAPPPPPPTASPGSSSAAAAAAPATGSGGAGLKGRQQQQQQQQRVGDQSRWYAYAAIDLMHTDHDGVFLLF